MCKMNAEKDQNQTNVVKLNNVTILNSRIPRKVGCRIGSKGLNLES